MYSFSDFALEHLKIDTLISYYCQELGQRREFESSAVPHNLQIRDLGLRITFLTINKLLRISPAQLSNTNPKFNKETTSFCVGKVSKFPCLISAGTNKCPFQSSWSRQETAKHALALKGCK